MDAFRSGGVEEAAVPLPRRQVAPTSPSDPGPVEYRSGREASPMADPVVVTEGEGYHGGLTRRVPGTHMAADVGESADEAAHPYAPGRDPEAERDALNDYLSGLARGGDGPNDPEGDA